MFVLYIRLDILTATVLTPMTIMFLASVQTLQSMCQLVQHGGRSV